MEGGSVADVYYKAFQVFADRNGTGLDGLLGYVIVHEIGHLLLGPGHGPGGIMHSPWKRSEVAALERRWLKFTPAQRADILRNLKKLNSEAGK